MNYNKKVRVKKKMKSTASILVDTCMREEKSNDGGISINAEDDDDHLDDGGVNKYSFDANIGENEGDKNGEEDVDVEDDSNGEKEWVGELDTSNMCCGSGMGQFVKATYLTEESTSNVKVALKMRKLTTNKEEEIKKLQKNDLN